jgi:hypothetical protein
MVTTALLSEKVIDCLLDALIYLQYSRADDLLQPMRLSNHRSQGVRVFETRAQVSTLRRRSRSESLTSPLLSIDRTDAGRYCEIRKGCQYLIPNSRGFHQLSSRSFGGRSRETTSLSFYYQPGTSKKQTKGETDLLCNTIVIR